MVSGRCERSLIDECRRLGAIDFVVKGMSVMATQGYAVQVFARPRVGVPDMLPPAPPFLDRSQAGHEMADRLGFLAGREDLTVVGLAPGGIPVAAELAEALDTALEVMVVRPLIVLGPSEPSFGAVTSGGARSVDLPAVKRYHRPAGRPVTWRKSKSRRPSERRISSATTRRRPVCMDEPSSSSTMASRLDPSCWLPQRKHSSRFPRN